MVIGIFAESCMGKSTLADKLKENMNAQVYTGRDYLRLEKNEDAAKLAFKKKLREAIDGENIIYVISGHTSVDDVCKKNLATIDFM